MIVYMYPFRWAPDSLVEHVWQKAKPVSGLDPKAWRQDWCGALICRTYHGDESNYGWEIDRIVPKAQGGTDDIENLQPLHWENNRHKGDDFPNWKCKRGA